MGRKGSKDTLVLSVYVDLRDDYRIAGNISGIKFGSWPPNHHCKKFGGFKFGGSVKDHHMYIICKCEILANFNLAVAKQTAKPPNLIPRQIFWLNDM